MDYIVKICCDGTLQKVDVFGKGMLSAIHEHLDGFFEIIRYAKVPKPYVMLVDDAGQLKGLHYNKIASQLYGASIVGDALIMVEDFTDTGEPDLFYLNEREADDVVKYLNVGEFVKKQYILIPYDSAQKYNAHLAKDTSLLAFIMTLDEHNNWRKIELHPEVEIMYCEEHSKKSAPFYNHGLKQLFGIDGAYSAVLIIQDTEDVANQIVSVINSLLRSNETDCDI